MKPPLRSPFTKALLPTNKLNDQDLKKMTEDLGRILNKDFPLHKKWQEIERMLLGDEVKALKLCKVLYCMGYRKEMFLHLGVIVESRINSIINLYKAQNWRTPQNYIDLPSQEAKFDQFLNKNTLSEKANFIFNLNLFNNLDFSDQIRHKVQAFRFLRNYGGHSKSVNEFFQSVIDSQPDCDMEIEDAFNLIRTLDNGVLTLIRNPPMPV